MYRSCVTNLTSITVCVILAEKNNLSQRATEKYMWMRRWRRNDWHSEPCCGWYCNTISIFISDCMSGLKAHHTHHILLTNVRV